MIVDTSALVAVSFREAGRQAILEALLEEAGIVPSPVLVEFRLVTSLEGNAPDPHAELLLAEVLSSNLSVEAFTPADAEEAFAAIERHGRGNGRGGKLNMLDLMVYGMAKRTGRPILCTGTDYAGTDIPIHPASRPW